ncbi:uncharacterized protein LOC124124987 isoform X2 [Haliotis rufescens]|uniref:uncharacterized protein LOC124124987 isoform X2 n=1 Tax=Haliotis rufescens TaxID=6454 RepID=UPI001EB094FA|nr:uncharacterized protein LOC124124987 isoform X2 [Haliotis rufescens]
MDKPGPRRRGRREATPDKPSTTSGTDQSEPPNLPDQEIQSDRLRDTILPYVRPALEGIIFLVVIYLLCVHCTTPDHTERALLDVLKGQCGNDAANAKKCIQKLLTRKNSNNVCKNGVREECVTPDLTHLESQFENLKQQFKHLRDNKWIARLESVFDDPSHMSEPLIYLKDNYRDLETISSAGAHSNDGTDLSGVEAKVKKLENSIEDVNKDLTETKTKLTETSTKLTETNTKLTETSTKLTETNSKLVKVEDSTVQHERWKGVVQDTVIPDLKSQIGHLSKTAEDVKQATDKTGSLLNGHIVWANSTYAEFKNHRSDTNKKVSEFARKHDTTERKLDGEELDGAMTKAELDHLKGRTTVYDFAFLLTLLNIIAVVFVVMYVRQTQSSATASSTAPASTAAASRNNVQRGSRREELYELQWSRPMEDSVCVVAFHTETEGRHADQTRSVFESVKQPCPTIHSRVIRRHTDITQLPGSRVFLVFVDFNERNVILEDPTKGLGDLRVTTVRSLWRFGADVTVIYCGDQGSVNLDSRLFNQDLGSIHRQQELTQLKSDERILSIYSDFSNTQRQHCRNFINRLLHVT